MATIVIKDLVENVDLDRDAMRAVLGGSRTRGPYGGQSRLWPTRIFDLRKNKDRQRARPLDKPA
jgi:hypothetical protein